MKILSYCSTIILLAESVSALAIEDIINDHEGVQLVRRVEPKRRQGALSVPPNGRTPLSRETKYQEAKKEAALDPKPKLERSKSLPNRPNPVLSNVAEKESQAGQALKKLRSAQHARQSDADTQFEIWDTHLRGQASPAASYRTLQSIGNRNKAIEPLFQDLANTYASAGQASMDAGLRHRAMRNKLKEASTVADGQLTKNTGRLLNNMMTGHMLPAVALERAAIAPGRHDPAFLDYIQKATRARGRYAERSAAVQRGQAKVEELRRIGGHDSESDGYDSEKSNIP